MARIRRDRRSFGTSNIWIPSSFYGASSSVPEARASWLRIPLPICVMTCMRAARSAKMIALPNKLTETPHTWGGAPNGHPRRDPELASPEPAAWSSTASSAATIACWRSSRPAISRLSSAADKLISYHYVRSGKMIVEVEGSRRSRSKAGEIAILPRNDPHLLASRAGFRPADAERDQLDHRGRRSSGVDRDRWARRPKCGAAFSARRRARSSAARRAAAAADAQCRRRRGAMARSSMRFLAEQQPSPEIVARLAELFLAQAIREYVEHLPPASGGWLRGLADPAVSKALSIIHKRYAEDLDVEGLAREAGVSRSVLGERFAELIGEPPMRYCARWRMRIAANMLRDGKENTGEHRLCGRLHQRGGIQPRVQARIWRCRPRPGAGRSRRRERVARRGARRAAAAAAACVIARRSDGTRLAYSVVGEGPPLVKTANWLNHIEYDWESPLWRHWIQEFTRGRTLVRYDERGNGLSDWDTPELSLEAFVDDLDAWSTRLELETFDLLAISQGAAVAIAYARAASGAGPAADHLQRLCARAGRRARPGGNRAARGDADADGGRLGRGQSRLPPAVHQPSISRARAPSRWAGSTRCSGCRRRPKMRSSCSGRLSKIDVPTCCRKVRHPTLVFHSREDQAVPFAQGEVLAGRFRARVRAARKPQPHPARRPSRHGACSAT